MSSMGTCCAMTAYRACGDYDALLRVVEKDTGIRLAITRPKIALADLDACPKSTLKEPDCPAGADALYVQLASDSKMLELKNLLLETVEEHPAWPGEYRSNLLGECDLITSFLFYNDIAAMSVLHRSASEKMTRPAISIQKRTAGHLIRPQC